MVLKFTLQNQKYPGGVGCGKSLASLVTKTWTIKAWHGHQCPRRFCWCLGGVRVGQVNRVNTVRLIYIVVWCQTTIQSEVDNLLASNGINMHDCFAELWFGGHLFYWYDGGPYCENGYNYTHPLACCCHSSSSSISVHACDVNLHSRCFILKHCLLQQQRPLQNHHNLLELCSEGACQHLYFHPLIIQFRAAGSNLRMVRPSGRWWSHQ